MTKEEARNALTDYLNSTKTIWNDSVKLPITDVNLNTIVSDTDGFVKFETITFKGLLKTAYNLKDND